jgi:hypothetical protein
VTQWFWRTASCAAPARGSLMRGWPAAAHRRGEPSGPQAPRSAVHRRRAAGP